MVARGIEGREALWIGELTAKVFLRNSGTFCADARIGRETAPGAVLIPKQQVWVFFRRGPEWPLPVCHERNQWSRRYSHTVLRFRMSAATLNGRPQTRAESGFSGPLPAIEVERCLRSTWLRNRV